MDLANWPDGPDPWIWPKSMDLAAGIHGFGPLFDPFLVQNWVRNGAQILGFWLQIWPKTGPESGPKVVQKWSKMGQKWVILGPRFLNDSVGKWPFLTLF